MQALWELEHDPDGWMAQILMLRSYARTLEAYDRKPADTPDGPMKDLVEEFEFAEAEQVYLERQAKESGSRP